MNILLKKLNTEFILKILRPLFWISMICNLSSMSILNSLGELNSSFYPNMNMVRSFNMFKTTSPVLTLALLFIFLVKWFAQDKYEKNGSLESWYDKSNAYFGTDWIVEIGDKIINLNKKPLTELTFISPSSNKGIYEKCLFKHWLSSNIDVKMIASDLALIENHEDDEIHGDSYFKYFERKDAINIKSLLHENNIDSIDIIWDFKGALWYSSKENEIINLIDIYYDSLNTDGYLLIDNFSYKWYNPIFQHFSNLILKSTYVSEESTFHKLSATMEKHDYLRKYISDKFTIIHLNSKFNSKINVVALQKKS